MFIVRDNFAQCLIIKIFFALLAVSSFCLSPENHDYFWLDNKAFIVGASSARIEDDFNPAPYGMVQKIIEDSTVEIRDQKLVWKNTDTVVETLPRHHRKAPNYHYFSGEEPWAYLFDGEKLMIAPRYVSLSAQEKKNAFEFIIYHPHLVEGVYLVDNEYRKFAASAGMIKLNRDGKIEFLSNRSGHFKTREDQFDLFVAFLERQGVFADNVKFESYRMGKEAVILDLGSHASLCITYGLKDCLQTFTTKDIYPFVERSKNLIGTQESAFPRFSHLRSHKTENFHGDSIKPDFDYFASITAKEALHLFRHHLAQTHSLSTDAVCKNIFSHLLDKNIIDEKNALALIFERKKTSKSFCFVDMLEFLGSYFSLDQIYSELKKDLRWFSDVDVLSSFRKFVAHDVPVLNALQPCNKEALAIFICIDVKKLLEDSPNDPDSDAKKNLIEGCKNILAFHSELDSELGDKLAQSLIELLKSQWFCDDLEIATYSSRLSCPVAAFYATTDALSKVKYFFSSCQNNSNDAANPALQINENHPHVRDVLFSVCENLLSKNKYGNVAGTDNHVRCELPVNSFFPEYVTKKGPVSEMAVYQLLATLFFRQKEFSHYVLENFSDREQVDQYLDLLCEQAESYLKKLANTFRIQPVSVKFTIALEKTWPFATFPSILQLPNSCAGFGGGFYKMPDFVSTGMLGSYVYEVWVTQDTIREALTALEKKENHPLLLALGALRFFN